MENNNESKRKSLTLGEFDVKVILDCLDKELSKELTDWGPVWGEMTYVFHKIKKDGTMSQINQSIGGRIISIHKI